MIGKKIRINRISDRATGNCVIVPMDHGITWGPIEGLKDPKLTVDQVAEGGATAVLMHRGTIPNAYRGYGKDVGMIMHMSASTNLGETSDEKVLVSSVNEAIKNGADAVSVHLNIGAKTEAQMLSDIGNVSRDCMEWGIPLLVMAYPRGPEVKNPFDPELVAHAARVAAELGADIIKCNYTGDPESFEEVVKGAMVPVVIAGGDKMGSDRDILEMVYDSIQAGGRGVSIGRNVFQHKDMQGMTRAISDIVLNKATVDEAIRQIKG